ncbi:hypothetical protein BC739_006028 [Kutzneria viridogrisea]|uniref:DUF3558 domain-containing protein n=1 Tax=Kutzneria viridogrisea TaxID=47990 RepID=A0ABR6BPH6_9PSEU|nr:hypothetical protein [Kutzneria viridogrisea]
MIRIVAGGVLVGMFAVTACGGATPPAAQPPAPKAAAPAARLADRPLPTDCALVAAAEDVTKALGRELPGTTNRVLGLPVPKINRTGRVDCYYGVGTNDPVTAAPVSIGVATYGDEASARERVAATVDAAKMAGDSTAATKVGPEDATLVAAKDTRTLVVAHGKSTVVVDVRRDLLAEDKAGPALTALAVRALTESTGPAPR